MSDQQKKRPGQDGERMLLCDGTYPTLAGNLALDEWLWLQAEQRLLAGDVLRIWEAREHAVIIGRGSKIAKEVHDRQCQLDGIPILRRTTGGAAIVCGPGCLMYAVIIRQPVMRSALRIDLVHDRVLSRITAGLRERDFDVQRAGTSDLVLSCHRRLRKFSGNSLRCGRTHALYHGTLLYDMHLARISRWLLHPDREPEYRAGREHSQFLANLPISQSELRQVLLDTFAADQRLQRPDDSQITALSEDKYENPAWTRSR